MYFGNMYYSRVFVKKYVSFFYIFLYIFRIYDNMVIQVIKNLGEMRNSGLSPINR